MSYKGMALGAHFLADVQQFADSARVAQRIAQFDSNGQPVQQGPTQILAVAPSVEQARKLAHCLDGIVAPQSDGTAHVVAHYYP